MLNGNNIICYLVHNLRFMENLFYLVVIAKLMQKNGKSKYKLFREYSRECEFEYKKYSLEETYVKVVR